MNTWKPFVTILCLLLTPVGNAEPPAHPPVLRCSLPLEVQKEVVEFLTDRPLMSVTNFMDLHISRSCAEAVLFQQILRAGGYEGEIRLQVVPSHERAIVDLARGYSDVSFIPFWRSDVNPWSEHIAVSSPLFQGSASCMGLYTVEGHSALTATNVTMLRDLRVVGNKHKKAEFAALKDIGFRRLHHAARVKGKPEMVRAGRADAFLSPFPISSGLSKPYRRQRLVPIPNYYVYVDDTLHLAFSRKSPHSEQLQTTVDRGIRELDHLKRFNCFILKKRADQQLRDWQAIPAKNEENTP